MREDLFTVLLLKLVVNLKPGIYDLKFYFYMDSSIVTYVYTFDFFFWQKKLSEFTWGNEPNSIEKSQKKKER